MKNAKFSNTGNIVNFKKNDNTNKYISSTDFNLTPNTLLNGQFSKTFSNITFRYLIFYNSGTAYCKFTQGTCDIQLEKGSTATDYIPHEEQTVTFPLASGQYMAKGDYLADNGIHHVMGRMILDGTETGSVAYSDDTVLDNYYLNAKSTYIKIVESWNLESKCNYLENLGHSPAYSRKANTFNLSKEPRLYFSFEKGTFGSFEAFTQHLANLYSTNKPFIIQYKLETEIIEPYTQEQQEAYNEIQKLMSYKGVTHISQENDNLPFNLKVVYRKDLEMILTSLDNRIKELENEGE